MEARDREDAARKLIMRLHAGPPPSYEDPEHYGFDDDLLDQVEGLGISRHRAQELFDEFREEVESTIARGRRASEGPVVREARNRRGKSLRSPNAMPASREGVDTRTVPQSPKAQSACPGEGDTLATLARQHFHQPAHLVEDLLPAHGFAVLGGAPKCGKSIFCDRLLLAIADGAEQFIGRGIGKQHRGAQVLLLALEATPQETQTLFRRLLGRDESWPRNVHVRTRNDLPAAPEERKEWLRRLLGRIRPALVVLDPLVRYRPPIRAALAYQDDYSFADELREMGQHFECLILGVHHTAKTARGADPGADLIATHGLAGASSAILGLRHEPGSKRATLTTTGNVVPFSRVHLAWRASELLWEPADHAIGRPDDQRRRATDWLRQALETGPVPASEIKSACQEQGVCSPRLLDAVKADLKVQSRKQGRTFYWELSR